MMLCSSAIFQPWSDLVLHSHTHVSVLWFRAHSMFTIPSRLYVHVLKTSTSLSQGILALHPLHVGPKFSFTSTFTCPGVAGACGDPRTLVEYHLRGECQP